MSTCSSFIVLMNTPPSSPLASQPRTPSTPLFLAESLVETMSLDADMVAECVSSKEATSLTPGHDHLAILDKISTEDYQEHQEVEKPDLPDRHTSVIFLEMPFEMIQHRMGYLSLKRTYLKCAVVDPKRGVKTLVAAERTLRDFLGATPSDTTGKEKFFQAIVSGLHKCLDIILLCAEPDREIEGCFASVLFSEMVQHLTAPDDFGSPGSPTFRTRLAGLLFNKRRGTFAERLYAVMILHRFFHDSGDPDAVIDWVDRIMQEDSGAKFDIKYKRAEEDESTRLAGLIIEDSFMLKFRNLSTVFKEAQVQDEFWVWVFRMIKRRGKGVYLAKEIDQDLVGFHRQDGIPDWPSFP